MNDPGDAVTETDIVATAVRSRRRPAPNPQAGLAALAEIAARLTVPDSLERVAQDVLERAHVALGARECVAWLWNDATLVRAWGTGDETMSAHDVLSLREQTYAEPDTRIIEMRFGTRSVGLLSVRLAGPIAVWQTHFLDSFANQLSAFIASAERSRRLEGDLEVRLLEIEAQRRFTETVVDSLPLGLYVIDRDYRVTAWNRNREVGMQGISRGQAIGRTIFEVLHRQPADMLRREFDDVFASGRMQQIQVESTTSGQPRTYRLSKIPIRDLTQRVTHVLTIGEDITDWVEARERVSQNEKLAAIGRLAAGIMHEINNPLATIAACAESMALILPKEGDENEPPYLTIIESEVQRCKRIIDGLLDFSRPQPLQRQSLNVNVATERALFLLTHHARFKQLTVESVLAPELPMVSASAEQLIQVLIALLMNAADAMPQYGRVIVRTYTDNSRLTQRGDDADLLTPCVVIEVEDEGAGIPRSQMTRIFEPFYTTKGPGRGTGLGLAICYGIVAEHGGRIAVESEPGKGSTFRIFLPVETL